ncbi:PREDICTED: 33 kDa inner dynein arm light chain, axonemal-like [Amphimedon queenslandica]|uniref:Axonemal dynein light intermediate polypeptide 1 n=1 Tax=Amphimedon queenslandica TaxID=400682 RepID=A0A1X7UXA5_AMPQE|nr:PREDICTED: 33 kDa inner dynein arm light chain, axonemal-like [Amphimedon queenslandica]|eukprot:XP_003386434.1 PREDICTED: 33 kDa inner dynein arm light chain, axonemal-like [Amphimedon queenslandica]
MSMIVPTETLVKYDNPTLVSKNTDKRTKPKTPKTDNKQAGTIAVTGSGGPLPGLPKNKLTPVEAQKNQQTEEILNSILPPREWSEEGQLWKQCVSSTPATRLDVINLQEQLDTKLQQRQARETGICPVRRELYSQCFDELIRQVTINCSERGTLLLRVRDEIRMTIAAYQTLYESSVAFGVRKALMSEQGKGDMEERIEKLSEEKRDLEQQVLELKNKCDAIEKRENENRKLEEKKHQEEIQALKKTNTQLQAQLEGIIAPQKK